MIQAMIKGKQMVHSEDVNCCVIDKQAENVRINSQLIKRDGLLVNGAAEYPIGSCDKVADDQKGDEFVRDVAWSNPHVRVREVLSVVAGESPINMILGKLDCGLNTEASIPSGNSSHGMQRKVDAVSDCDSKEGMEDEDEDSASIDDKVVEEEDVTDEEDSKDPPYLPDWGIEDEQSAVTDGLIVASDSWNEVQQKRRSKSYESDTEIISIRRKSSRKAGGLGEVTSFFGD